MKNSALSAVMCLSIASYAALATAEETRLVDPELSIAGKTQAEWSVAWWQWAGSFPRDESPVADTTGELCAAGQSGPVWFLAGAYGTNRTTRACHVPRGKHLFFPLINYVVGPTSSATPCELVVAIAKRASDDPASLVFDLDGARAANLGRHRQSTPRCFDFGARAGVKVFPAAADGYYAMVEPLAPGIHTLNFGGLLPSMAQAITYTLIVD